ncbi:MAG: hypothetical protein KatS3mg038_0621 [Candidatus Kapaibacterium sp.]|nr:MAG: hypothetical protein KatS3mg038_0621 [Candidatus Kapabacteria bacterium]
MPDVAVAAVLLDAIDDGLDRIDLIGAHHHEPALGLDQHHVAADHFRQGALGEERLGEIVEVCHLFVVRGGPLVDGQIALIGVKAEMFGVVVGEVIGGAEVADDKKLHKAKQGAGIAVARILLVLDDLLHGPAGADLEGLQLDLHQR